MIGFNKKKVLLLAGCALCLSACSSLDIFGSSKDKPLPGERVSVLELQKQLEPENLALEAQGFIAPQPWQNEFWPQRGGYPNHSMQNLALTSEEGELKKVWSVSIGEGSVRNRPLMVQPIVVGGKVYTLDTNQNLRAFQVQDGKQVWQASLKPKSEKESAIGGGLAFGEGTIFATNGFAELLAIDPQDGAVLWVKKLPALSRTAPTVLDQKVYVQLADNQILALNTGDGVELWRYTGFSAEAGLLGGSSPAVNTDLIVGAFSSGELTALNAKNGTVMWSDSLAPRHKTGGLSSISDVTGLPVIDQDLVIATGFGGRMLAINAETGRRVWQRDIGSYETPWVAGNHVFVITTDRKLVSLGRDSGSVSWVLDLAKVSKNTEESWTGPLLANGRLILASSHGRILTVSPDDGQVLQTLKEGSGVTVPPVLAAETLYILDSNGRLTAYR